MDQTETLENLDGGPMPKLTQNPKRIISNRFNQTEPGNMCCGEPLNNQTEPSTNAQEIALDEDSWSDLTDASSGTDVKVCHDENRRKKIGDASLLFDDEKKEPEDGKLCPYLKASLLGLSSILSVNYLFIYGMV